MSAATGSADNRLGIDYRTPPPRAISGPILDIHCHLYAGPHLQAYFEAADLYRITRMVSMSPLADVPTLQREHPGRLDFIAIPNWREMAYADAFRDSWMRDLERFRALGARLCKLWMAPRIRQQHGLSANHPFVRPVVDEAIRLGYNFMIHVADPSAWWEQGKPYFGDARVGAKEEQYPQLEWLCDHVAPRFVIAAHMGGFIERPDFLESLLQRFPNLYLDTSATKWIVRGVSQHPDAVRGLIQRHPERFLFGSDQVARVNLDSFEHYASRYWSHQTLWETHYRGESPIADPDAPFGPQLAGLALPPDVLRKLYSENAARLGFSAV